MSLPDNSNGNSYILPSKESPITRVLSGESIVAPYLQWKPKNEQVLKLLNLPHTTNSNILGNDLGVKAQLDKKSKWLLKDDATALPLININLDGGRINVLDPAIVGLPILSRGHPQFNVM